MAFRIDKQLYLHLSSSWADVLLKMTGSIVADGVGQRSFQFSTVSYRNDPPCTGTDIRFDQDRKRNSIRKTVLREKGLRVRIPFFFTKPHQAMFVESLPKDGLIRKTIQIQTAHQHCTEVLKWNHYIKLPFLQQLPQIRFRLGIILQNTENQTFIHISAGIPVIQA